MTTLFYPDISAGQAGMSTAGRAAICVKATEGTYYTNPDYGRAKSDAAAHGVFQFAYHFLTSTAFGGSPAAQAAYCHNVVGDVPLMLDQENEKTSNPTIAEACAFIDAYRKLGGAICNLEYLPRWYWQNNLGSPSLQPLKDRHMRLVSSDYTTYSDSDSAPGWQAYGGMDPAVWQFTNQALVNGRMVDRNAFRGTLAEFESLVRTGKEHAGPYRHVVPAGNTQTFEALLSERHTLRANIETISKGKLDADHLAFFEDFLAMDSAAVVVGAPHPAMPAGWVYYTENP